MRLGMSQLIQYQILRTSIIRIVWQTVRRITNEILGVKKLGALAMVNYIVLFDDTLLESLSPQEFKRVKVNCSGKMDNMGG